MNIPINTKMSSYDDEETILKALQEIIDYVYCKHPNLHYQSRPVIMIEVNPHERRVDLTNKKQNDQKDKYESVIMKLCEALNLMDDEDFQNSIDNNEKLQEIYCTINDTTNKLESVQRTQNRTEKNKEIVKDCIDIECQFRTKYKDVDKLMKLIYEYRTINHLTTEDIQRLISRLTTASKLLEHNTTLNEGEKVCEEELLDGLANVLLYCFELARSQHVPIDRVIARKIKKNLQQCQGGI